MKDGCEIAAFCEGCPLPKCIYDEPGLGASGLRRRNRDEAIVERVKAGAHPKEVAREFHISLRTTQRVLRSL